MRDAYSLDLRLNRKRVAVITYTNAASDEIKHRLDYNPLFLVSTIHSFAWELVCTYQEDIREWLREKIKQDIAETEELLRKGRAGTKVAADREAIIRQKNIRLDSLDYIRQFTYSPKGQNNTRDSLNHAEVIKIAADFLQAKPLMREILISRFPILFIDESQDTKQELMDALFAVQAIHGKQFSLGLFGDMMQRIYPDGKVDLGRNLPEDWLKPVKRINYRCPKRVVTLINKIRSQVDDQMQEPKVNQIEGQARLFIIPRNNVDKEVVENTIAVKMSEITNDELWHGITSDIKILILEHHMAASRMGFLNLFTALSKDKNGGIGLLDGTLPGIRFFTQLIMPLVKANAEDDAFTIARIIKQTSPLLDKKIIKDAENPNVIYQQVDRIIEFLLSLWKENQTPTLMNIIENIHKTGLFVLPEIFSVILRAKDLQGNDTEGVADEYNESSIIAWQEALNCSWMELERYHVYISGQSRFGTHQGVKGLQFPRVMVIIDDEEARGFMFKYDKLFGVQALSDTDKSNLQDGKETSIDRTLRLFYVSCSRAE